MENRSKAEKDEFEKNYPGFSITDEIERFKEVFNVSINLYKYSPDEKKYPKLHYYEKQDSQYPLNISLVPVENGEHAIWLKEFDNALQCYVCSKYNLRTFNNFTSHKGYESYSDGSKLTKNLSLLLLNVQLIPTAISTHVINILLLVVKNRSIDQPILYYL
jgi:hypothetical protein